MNENNEINNANNANESNENQLDLLGQFARVEWLLHRHHQKNHRLHGPMGDTHRGQGRVLAILKMQPEISQKDLSYLLDMRPQSMGELLAKLERGGFIARTHSETDRRIINIKLTEEGLNTISQKPNYDNMFECLEEKEQAELNGYLSRIILYMEEQFEGEDFDSHSACFAGSDMDERFSHHGRDRRRDGFHGTRGHMGNMSHGSDERHFAGNYINRGRFGSRQPMHHGCGRFSDDSSC